MTPAGQGAGEDDHHFIAVALDGPAPGGSRIVRLAAVSEFLPVRNTVAIRIRVVAGDDHRGAGESDVVGAVAFIDPPLRIKAEHHAASPRFDHSRQWESQIKRLLPANMRE